ncbi:MAG TPA: hypothetical protein VIF09_23285 [Polyangiaceae bacterium]|jgi:hypothetical protein
MKSFKMEIELVGDACAADAWAMAQSRLADIARVIKVVDVDSGEFVKPLSARPRITMAAGKAR